MPTKHNPVGHAKARGLKISASDSQTETASEASVPLAARVDALESLCGELYQVLGNAGASEQVLDKVWAAANGDPIPDVQLLPSQPMDFDEVRERQETIDEMASLLARHLAARGGRQKTEAKRLASQANGRKGGRPRKTAGV